VTRRRQRRAERKIWPEKPRGPLQKESGSVLQLLFHAPSLFPSAATHSVSLSHREQVSPRPTCTVAHLMSDLSFNRRSASGNRVGSVGPRMRPRNGYFVDARKPDSVVHRGCTCATGLSRCAQVSVLQDDFEITDSSNRAKSTFVTTKPHYVIDSRLIRERISCVDAHVPWP
jgi:hypothetical protein